MAAVDGVLLTAEERKDIVLGLLDAFDAFCSQHGLEYVLGYGTALGAVRHNGFIPWDDDADVCMPRESYERFLELWHDTPGIRLYAPDRGIDYLWATARLADTRTVCDEDNVHPHFRMGVFMDVFPIDSLPNSLLARSLFLKRAQLLKGAYRNRPAAVRGAAFPGRRGRELLGSLLFSSDESSNWGHLVSWAGLGKPRPSSGRQYVGLVFSPYADGRDAMPRDWVYPGVRHAFEGRSLIIPCQFDKYLTKIYGEWRVPVKQEDRLHGSARWLAS